MSISSGMKDAFSKAIKQAGGQSSMARLLSTEVVPVTQQRLWHWLKKGVCPAEYVLRVEGITGVSRHDLRPDVFGPGSAAAQVLAPKLQPAKAA